MRPNEDNCPALIKHEDGQQVCLSRESRRNFDIIRSMISACETIPSDNDEEGDPKPTVPDNDIPVPSLTLKRREIDEMAEVTMQKVQQEISHWEQGIKEMEYLLSLAAADEDDANMDFEEESYDQAALPNNGDGSWSEAADPNMATEDENPSDNTSQLESNTSHRFQSTPLH